MTFTEADLIFDVPEWIIFVSKTMFSVTNKTAFVSAKIVSPWKKPPR